MLILSLFNRNGRCLYRNVHETLPLTLGRSSQCEAQVKVWGIQKEHLRVNKTEQGLQIQAVQPGNCVLNGLPIAQTALLRDNDDLRLGSYRLQIRSADTVEDSPGIDRSSEIQTSSAEKEQNSKPQEEPSSSMDQALYQQWQSQLHRELVSDIDLRRVNLDDYTESQLRQEMTQWIQTLLDGHSDFPATLNRDLLIDLVVDEAIGLGPLESLLRDDAVSEIMVNEAREIFFEEGGKLHRSEITFSNNEAVLAAIERIVSPLGRRIDEASPMVDARLADGSRVNAVIPPLALKGPSLTIRKFSKKRLSGENLEQFGSLNAAMLTFLRDLVRYRQNLLISGGTGSGKTTLLNLLSDYIPDNERIVTVEDAAELSLNHSNQVNLEARPANQEGKGAVTIRDLVRNCLRMRPDRIIVGECRGGEALDMLQAMNTGHDGSLTTAHANSPRDSLARLEVMIMMAGMDLPLSAVREQIASSLNYVIQQSRFSCGQRKVTSICEVNGLDNGTIQLSEIFRFVANGYDTEGRVQGNFEATGLIPEFYTRQETSGRASDLSIFQQESYS